MIRQMCAATILDRIFDIDDDVDGSDYGRSSDFGSDSDDVFDEPDSDTIRNSPVSMDT